jgi:DNA-binding PadR family transcriptional regulator
LYILKLLEGGPMSPTDIKVQVFAKYRFAPATITFYTVLYRLRREGLVKRVGASFRSEYEMTPKGKEEFRKGRALIRDVLDHVG